MNCDGVRVLLSAYLDGELSPGELLRVEQHLRRCHSCAAEVDSLRQTIALVGSMDEVAIPATFHAQLHSRLIAVGPPVPGVRRIPAAPGWQRNLGRWAVPAAAAAAALAVGLTNLPHARQLTGLEGRQGNVSLAPAPQHVDNTPNVVTVLPPPPAIEPSGKPNDPDQTPSNKDPAIEQPGGTTDPVPAPNLTDKQPPVAPLTEPVTAPPIESVSPPKGENVIPPGQGVVVKEPPAGSNQPAAPLTPKNTISSDATVTTADAEKVTRALAAFHPTLEGDTIYVMLPAAQRKAVEDAVRNASGVQVVSGFAVVQTDLSGTIHRLEGEIAFYRQQVDYMEKQIPKLKGQEQEDALAHHGALMDKIQGASETLDLVNSQVDMAKITVHVKVQGR